MVSTCGPEAGFSSSSAVHLRTVFLDTPTGSSYKPDRKIILAGPVLQAQPQVRSNVARAKLRMSIGLSRRDGDRRSFRSSSTYPTPRAAQVRRAVPLQSAYPSHRRQFGPCCSVPSPTWRRRSLRSFPRRCRRPSDRARPRNDSSPGLQVTRLRARYSNPGIASFSSPGGPRLQGSCRHQRNGDEQGPGWSPRAIRRSRAATGR